MIQRQVREQFARERICCPNSVRLVFFLIAAFQSVCRSLGPSVRRSVIHTRVWDRKWDFRTKFEQNMHLKNDSEKRIARTHLMFELCQICRCYFLPSYKLNPEMVFFKINKLVCDRRTDGRTTPLQEIHWFITRSRVKKMINRVCIAKTGSLWTTYLLLLN